jgi:hypothetical protein
MIFLEFAPAPVLGVVSGRIAARFPVDPLQREKNPVGGVDTLLIGGEIVAKKALGRHIEGFAVLSGDSAIAGDRFQLFHGVFRIPMKRPDPDDLVVLDIDATDGPAVRSVLLEYGCFRLLPEGSAATIVYC